MLAPKKIEKKKIIIYAGIIAAMLLGTAIMLYQSYGSAPTEGEVIQLPADLAGLIASSSAVSPSINKRIRSLDTSIFGNAKLRGLKEIFINRVFKASAGKNNPFAPNLPSSATTSPETNQ